MNFEVFDAGMTSSGDRRIDWEMDRTEGMTALELEITHFCNKMCPSCDHRIRYSDYSHLTWDDYEHILSCIGSLGSIRKLLLIGGEPLCHPEFSTLLRRVMNDFMAARIWVSTNGTLLDQLDPELRKSLSIEVSHYPGFNDRIVEEHRRDKNVVIYDRSEMWNPYRDPRLSQAEAKRIRAQCLYQVRLVGTRMYGCCLSEAVERYYKTDPVHVAFTRNWRDDFRKLPTWKACQHCFRAIDWFGASTHNPSRA